VRNDPKRRGNNDLRLEARTESKTNASVEFIPGGNEITYHFSLKDFSSKGFGIMVRKDSKVLKHIKTGDILEMRFHPDEATANPELHRTKIQHISEPEPGKHQNHMIVGLSIL